MTATAIQIPTIETGWIRLRAPGLADFERWPEFFASDRAGIERGPLDRVRGYRTGAFPGGAGICQPAGFPGPEPGWFVVPEAEGEGHAFEGAQAATARVRETLGRDRLCSIIDPGNTRSIALRLHPGGVIDPSLPGLDPGNGLIRHDLRGGHEPSARGGTLSPDRASDPARAPDVGAGALVHRHAGRPRAQRPQRRSAGTSGRHAGAGVPAGPAGGRGMTRPRETARAVRDHILGQTGFATLVCCIDAGNAPSITVARRLGAGRDRAAESRPGERLLVCRHQPKAAP